MTNTLTNNLRAMARCEHDDLSIGAEAADAIDALAAEVAALRAAMNMPDKTAHATTQFEGHTKGPWAYEVHELSEGYSGIVYDSHGRRIGTDHLSEADARLIAAAPDLLAERDALAAEVARLRAELERVAKRTESMATMLDRTRRPSHNDSVVLSALICIMDDICAALARKPGAAGG